MIICNMPMYRAIVLKQGLSLYLHSGKRITPNRAWTPTAMLRMASEITGKNFKRGQHHEAYLAISSWLEVARLKGETLQDEVPLS